MDDGRWTTDDGQRWQPDLHLGGAVDVDDTLKEGEEGEEGEGPDEGGDEAQGGENGDQEDALHAGEEPHLAGEAQGLRPGPGIADHERGDEGYEEEADLEKGSLLQTIGGEAQDEDGVGEAIQGRVEEGPEGVLLSVRPGHGAVEGVHRAEGSQ